MQKMTDVVLDSLGNAVQGASVTVTNTTGGLATIYSDNGVTTQGNPMTTDAAGGYSFYAANGRYNISASFGGVTATESDVILYDGLNTRTQLTGPYTLTANDDGKLFWANTSISVTLPAGLSPMPLVMFDPPAAGSITVTPTGGATIAASTSPYAINRATNPSGVCALSPYLDTANAYGVTTSGSAFSALTGLPTDNAALSTTLAGLAAVQPDGSKQTTAYTLTSADHDGFVWLAAQAADKAISVPATLPNNFRCFVGYLNNSAATGRCKIQSSGGSTLNWITQTPEAVSYAADTAQINVTPIFMGRSGSGGVAVAMIVNEGSAPGGTFFVIPMCGTFATV